MLSTAAFDYEFGALDDSQNALAEKYNNLMCVYPRAVWMSLMIF